MMNLRTGVVFGSLLLFSVFSSSARAETAGQAALKIEVERIARSLHQAVERQDYDRYNALILQTSKTTRDEWLKRLNGPQGKKLYTSFCVDPDTATFLKISELSPYVFYYYQTEMPGKYTNYILSVTVFKKEGDIWKISRKTHTHVGQKNKKLVSQAQMLEAIEKQPQFKMENLIQ